MRFLRRRGAIVFAAGLAALATVLSACSGPPRVGELPVPAQVDGAIPDETVQQLEAAVTAAMGASGSSGAIVGVWAPWSGEWVTALGTQSFAGGEIDADMTFRAADVTRAMTCDVLLQVAAEGTVSLDDSLTTWVPGFPGLGDITLDQLCDGTSGLGSYAPQLSPQWFGNPERAWNAIELASYGVGQGAPAAPGTAYRDSDAGYLLLGEALERATNRSMRALLDEYVAEPLELDATALPTAAAATPGAEGAYLEGHWSVPDAAGAWNCTEPAPMSTISASLGFSDSGAVTDITDLGRYAQALASEALAPDAERFAAPVAVPDQPTWFTATGGAYQAGSLIGQYGSVPGYMTAAFTDPASGLTVAVVLNNSGANAMISAWLAWELAAIASRAPAASGQEAPELALPWTAQQFQDQIAANAICAAPAS
jgi:D-alanyl-D-alanine carboxypeptidase